MIELIESLRKVLLKVDVKLPNNIIFFFINSKAGVIVEIFKNDV